MFKRIHWSKRSLTIPLKAFTQPLASYKPAGLWYEVSGDWQRWCASDWPDWFVGLQAYRIVLSRKVHLLRIATVQALDTFHNRFVIGKEIRWRLVALCYDGIEIAPYQWSRRLEYSWYYGWDCASGCLWRPKDTLVIPLKIVPALSASR